MKRGILVYAPEDVEKNRRFIGFLCAAAEKRGGELTLTLSPDLERPPDFALVRSRDWALARRLEEKGVPVYNSSFAIETANDKRLTFNRFEGLVPMPDTAADPKTPPFPYPFVVKPAHGHGGKNVAMAANDGEFYGALAACAPDGTVAQRPVTPGRDLRVYVIGNRVVTGMLRENDGDFRSNYSLGGRVRQKRPGAEELAIVEAVCATCPLSYGGVDIIYAADGTPLFNELEDAAGARMLYENTGLDIAGLYMDYIFGDLKKR